MQRIRGWRAVLATWVLACVPTAHPQEVPRATVAAPHVEAAAASTVARAPARTGAGSAAAPQTPPPDAAKPSPWLPGCVASVDELDSRPGVTPRRARRLERGMVLVADKGRRRMMLFEGGSLRACWRIALGWTPRGHKQLEGDGKTPVGWYRTSDKPWSSFDGAIAIHYPAIRDARAARQDGRISAAAEQRIVGANQLGKVPPQRTALGGAILIHGGGSSRDWTAGCIALDDPDLAELRQQLPAGMRTELLIVE